MWMVTDQPGEGFGLAGHAGRWSSFVGGSPTAYGLARDRGVPRVGRLLRAGTSGSVFVSLWRLGLAGGSTAGTSRSESADRTQTAAVNISIHPTGQATHLCRWRVVVGNGVARRHRWPKRRLSGAHRQRRGQGSGRRPISESQPTKPGGASSASGKQRAVAWRQPGQRRAGCARARVSPSSRRA